MLAYLSGKLIGNRLRKVLFNYYIIFSLLLSDLFMLFVQQICAHYPHTMSYSPHNLIFAHVGVTKMTTCMHMFTLFIYHILKLYVYWQSFTQSIVHLLQPFSLLLFNSFTLCVQQMRCHYSYTMGYSHHCFMFVCGPHLLSGLLYS